jgi:hypothetical protein
MKAPMQTLRALLVALPLIALTGGAALADCTVKYKAKQDNPLKLKAGKTTLPEAACGSKEAAAAALAPILAQQGWTLLAITAILPE